MLTVLPRFILFILNVLLVVAATAFNTLLIFICSVLKLLLPFGPTQRFFSRLNNRFMGWWLEANRLILSLTNRVEWDIEMPDYPFSKREWYLLTCNHQSWSDIVILGYLFGRLIPPPKFFLKHSLLFVPFVGLACWGLDMPFMRRYSREKLLKKPHLRGKDVEVTKKSCEKFRTLPTTVINFVEGTRFDIEKQRRLKSPYQHLLPPKAGGFSTALGAMGPFFNQLIDVTLLYPENQKSPFIDLLCGRMRRIVVRVTIHSLQQQELELDPQLTEAQQKRQQQQWLQKQWQEKDLWIESYYQQHPTPD
ncbi:acyltransferase [Dongshaea marina]|uniref:acyltransferase n=1 Tax=Dongshaea marina TaxID=2047966 RepID=UPI000D3E90F1|nr:acyltransferase [Dongshaea marina]